MTAATSEDLRSQLSDLRLKLESTISFSPEDDSHLRRLLHEVDVTLGKIGTDHYGMCEACDTLIGAPQLAADPLARFCLDCYTPAQMTALGRDLARARELQGGLLPRVDFSVAGWEIGYHYEPAGAVGGDFCDLVRLDGGDVLFFLGDVSGKGIAASVLVAHLQAIFHSLVTLGLPLGEMVGRANRIFCDFTMSVYYATLACGRAGRDGRVELVNAGHCPPLLFRRGDEARVVPATGLPVGMFREERYEVERLELAPGDGLFLYTDGLSEARDPEESEYGCERVARLVAEHCASASQAMVAACLGDLKGFCGGTEQTDDLTVMALRRAH